MDLLEGLNIYWIYPRNTAGDVITVKGKEYRTLQSHKFGDLKVLIKVTIPKKMNKRQKELFILVL